MKFFFSKQFVTKWLKGAVYLLLIKPLAFLVMGPYMEALQQERAAKALTEYMAQRKAQQDDEAKKRGN